MAGPKGYTDSLAQQFYRQIVANVGNPGAQQSTGVSPSPINWATTASYAGIVPQVPVSTPASDSSNLPDELQHPHNPYDWLVSQLANPKSLTRHLPVVGPIVSTFANDAGDSTTKIGKVVDLLSQPMYAFTEHALDTGRRVKDDVSKGQSEPLSIAKELARSLVTPVARDYGSGNEKITPSDILRGQEGPKYEAGKSNAGQLNANAYDNTSFKPLAANPNDNGWMRAAKGTAGLAADIAGDPLTYIPGGALKDLASIPAKTAGKVVRAVAPNSKLVEGLDNLAAKRAVLPAVAEETPAVADQVVNPANLPEEATPAAPVVAPQVPTASRDLALTRSPEEIAADAAKGVVPPVTSEPISQAMLRNSAGEEIPFDASKLQPTTEDITAPQYPGAKISDLLWPKAAQTVEKSSPQVVDKAVDSVVSEAPKYQHFENFMDRLSQAKRLPGAVEVAYRKAKDLEPTKKAVALNKIQTALFKAHPEYASTFTRYLETTGVSPRIPGGLTQDAAAEVRAADAQARSVADQAASRLAAARSANASRQRLTDPQEILTWVKAHSFLTPQDVNSLLSAKKIGQFYKRRSDILKRNVTTSVTRESDWEPFMAEVIGAPKMGLPENVAEAVTGSTIPDNIYDAGKVGLNQASDQISEALAGPVSEAVEKATDAVRQGAGITDHVANAIRKTIGDDDWEKLKPEFSHVSRKGTLRDSPTPNVGHGINRDGWNRTSQMNLAKHLLEDPDGISAQAAKLGLQGYKRSEYVGKELIAQLKSAEDFLLTNGIYSTASAGRSGIPLTLSQVLEAFQKSNEGRNLLNRRVFTLFSLRDSRSAFNKDGLVDFDALLHIGDIIAQTVGKKVQNAADIDAELAVQAKKIAKTYKKEFQKEIQPGSLRDITNDATEGIVYDEAGNVLDRSRGIGTGAKVEGKFVRARVSDEAGAETLDHVISVLHDPRIIHAILQSVHDNAGKAGIQFARAVAPITEQTMATVLSTLADATGKATFADKVWSLTDVDRVAKKVPAAQDARKATPQVIDAATDQAKKQMGEVVPDIDVKNAKTAKAITQDSGKETGGRPSRQTLARTSQKAEDGARSSLNEADLPTLVDPDAVADIVFQTTTMKMIDALSTFFSSTYGHATFAEAIRRSGTLLGVKAARTRSALNTLTQETRALAKVSGDMSRDVELQIFKAIQEGRVAELPTGYDQAVLQMKSLIDNVFDTGMNSGLADKSILSMFQREGFDLEHINYVLRDKKYNLADAMQLQTRVKKTVGVSKSGKPIVKEVPATAEDISAQWRSWATEDPLDFIDKINAIGDRLASDVGTSKHFQLIAKKNGLISTKPRPGYVKVTRDLKVKDKTGKEFESFIARYLDVDEKGVSYVHPDAYQQMKSMDRYLNDSYKSTGFDRFAKKNIDPIMQMWKSGVTVWRPGHHVRNLVGDVSLSFLQDGVKNPLYYYRALRMVRSKQGALGRSLRGSYGEFDAQQALLRVERAVKANPAGYPRDLVDEVAKNPMEANTFKFKAGGRDYEISASDFQRELMDRGNLPDFIKEEDIFRDKTFKDADKSVVQRVVGKAKIPEGLAKRKFVPTKEKLGKFSEGRDDFVRLAHAQHLLENGIDGKKWDGNIEDIFDQIAARVQKAHPDGSTLTPSESRYMRRIFPFYSWYRSAVPTILYNMLVHPGRATVYPKAMYNIAQAQGVDLDSLSDPFPMDQLFPNFINQNMTGVTFQGPDGHYFSVDPGVAQADVLNSYFAGGGAGMAGGILGMLTPLVKTPIELATGDRLDTPGQNVPIGSTQEYIDQQVPGVSAIASLTGTSPTATVDKALTGKGLGVVPTGATEKGNRSALPAQYLINWLTGAKVVDTSQPNYINLAEIQKRDAVNKAETRWDR